MIRKIELAAKRFAVRHHHRYVKWLTGDLTHQMSLSDFRDTGALAQINVDVLHPIGLGMWVEEDLDLVGVYDYRHDPEGLYFASEEMKDAAKEQMKKYQVLWDEKAPAREESLGYVVQDLDA